MERAEERVTTSPSTEGERAGERDLEREYDDLTLRTMNHLDDYRACVDLQRLVWGQEFSEVVPASILRVSAEVGGVVAGAFAPGGELVGFVYGLTGSRDGRLTHWSHMLGVRRTHRGSGVGYRLKQFQRELLVERGVPEMRWTFDPLVAANAHFNLTRLGAQVVGYVTDMYGDTGSRHHAFGTDRFLVSWSLVEPSEAVPSDVESEDDDLEPPFDAPVINAPPSSDSTGGEPGPFEGPRLRIAIPTDVVGLSRRSAAAAREWRDSTRKAFVGALRAGYHVVGFQRATAPDEHGHYWLRRHDP